MSKRKNLQGGRPSKPDGISLSAIDEVLKEPERTAFTHWLPFAAVAFMFLLGLGVFAKNGWLPHTDALTGQKTGWFGRELPKSAVSVWNPFAPPPSSTPALVREYIRAGSRLLASVDTGASEIPPTDLAVWRPSTGIWYILGASGTPPAYGLPEDRPVQGDFDGDGRTDFCVFRPSEHIWYIQYSSNPNSSVPIDFGLSGDKLAAADYDGDGHTDIAVWRPTNGYWYIRPSSDPGNMISIHYGGLFADVAVPADYDGDGRADVAIWRSSAHTFYSLNSSDGQERVVSLGSTGNTAVCADYDGDGRSDFAVLSGNTWTILNSSTNTTTSTPWQNSGDTPVPNDYDSDGKADIAVWHVDTGTKGDPGIWYIRQSRDASLRVEYWGKLYDIPVPAFYRH